MARPITYLLPVYWACALVNDDYTGLSDEEKKQINDFLETGATMPVLCPETVQNSFF